MGAIGIRHVWYIVEKEAILALFVFHTRGFQPFTTSDSQPQNLPWLKAGRKRCGHKKYNYSHNMMHDIGSLRRSVLRSCKMVSGRNHIKPTKSWPVNCNRDNKNLRQKLTLTDSNQEQWNSMIIKEERNKMFVKISICSVYHSSSVNLVR